MIKKALGAFVLLFFSLILLSNTRRTTGDILITNVHIIDTFRGKVIKNQNVLIRGERIVAIGNKKQKFDAKQVVDGTNKYLIPGLWDMHTHNFWDKHYSNYYVANGILGVRNMYTPMHLINPLSDSITSGLIPGPYYVAAGRVVEGKNPEFPDWLVLDHEDDIIPILDTLQHEGSNFVKVYNKIPRNLYFKLAAEARKRNMSIQGHVPMEVTAIEASNAGQKSIEHLIGIPGLCTRDTLFRGDYKNNWFAAIMKSDDLATMKIDTDYARQNFAILKKNKTYVVPTLSVWHNYLYPDERFEDDGISQKFSEDVRVFWFGAIDHYRHKDSLYKATSRLKYQTCKKITTLLYQSGVNLLTGTDAINPCVYPGFALHKELYLLKECGIPDQEVLKMATWNAAIFLGLENEFGSVETGKVASLVMLNANPLENIANTSDIHAVILKGKLFNRSALDAMLE